MNQVKTLNSFSVPAVVIDALGQHFENLNINQQHTLLNTLSAYIADRKNLEHEEDEETASIHDFYIEATGILPKSVINVFDDIEQMEFCSSGSILKLLEVLISNMLLHYKQ